MLQASVMIAMHDEATRRWHAEEASSLADPGMNLVDSTGEQIPRILQLARAHHRANFDLWHQEDEARSPSASESTIAQVKHGIDTVNQRRNDLVEQIDEALYTAAGTQNESAPLHSETPGLILDRLSILALKLYHTAEESHRESASEQHRDRNLARLQVLSRQRDDLALCLHELWAEILAGRRRFKLYRQMKMYNDPELNPVLYSKNAAATETALIPSEPPPSGKGD